MTKYSLSNAPHTGAALLHGPGARRACAALKSGPFRRSGGAPAAPRPSPRRARRVGGPASRGGLAGPAFPDRSPAPSGRAARAAVPTHASGPAGGRGRLSRADPGPVRQRRGRGPVAHRVGDGGGGAAVRKWRPRKWRSNRHGNQTMAAPCATGPGRAGSGRPGTRSQSARPTGRPGQGIAKPRRGTPDRNLDPRAPTPVRNRDR